MTTNTKPGSETKRGDNLETLLRASIERNDARALLREILAALDDEADIGWSGGPNLAMRLRSQFGDRIEALISPSAPGLLTLVAQDLARDDGEMEPGAHVRGSMRTVVTKQPGIHPGSVIVSESIGALPADAVYAAAIADGPVSIACDSCGVTDPARCDCAMNRTDEVQP